MAEHLTRHQLYYRENRERLLAKKRANGAEPDAAKKRRQRLKASHLCAVCAAATPTSCRTICDTCRERQKAYAEQLKRRRRQMGLCVHCGKTAPASSRSMCQTCLRKYRDWNHVSGHRERERVRKVATRQALKIAVLAAYGGSVCTCCGETQLMFLTIDHVDNKGCQHRKSVPSRDLYDWLKDNGFPPGFQVLCWNCNHGKHLNGGVCPHVGATNIARRAQVNAPIVSGYCDGEHLCLPVSVQGQSLSL